MPAGRTVRRIATITLGHSATLALGALGLPVPQRLVEALIAVSIRVHGFAFSATLCELDLTGTRLVLSLLGFNLGIEAMQLIIVAVILPPLILLARSGHYQRLRVVAAIATGIAAVGWLGVRVGIPNPVADAADQIGIIAIPLVLTLWLTATALAAPGGLRRQGDALGRGRL